MNWLLKTAKSDADRIRYNIQRLTDLKERIHRLAYIAVSSPRRALDLVNAMSDEQIVKGRDQVAKKINLSIKGENDQYLVLDAPTRFQRLMFEAEVLVKTEIFKEMKNLRELEEASNNGGEESG